MSAFASHSLQARIVCPVDRPAIDRGVVEIEAGRIVEIHSRPHGGTRNLGNVAIVPGLVNAHTHLEFSNLEAPLRPPHPFAAWIGAVVAERRRRTGKAATGGDAERDPLARGLAECFATGTTLIGDIATGTLDEADDRPAMVEALTTERIIRFRELLAPTAAGVASTWASADADLQQVEQLAAGARCGLSPHAPYTVTGDLLEQAVERAVQDDRPVAMHLAETREELELLEQGSGPLVEMLMRIGQWSPGNRPGTRPIDLLRVLSRAPQSLIVHGNYLTRDELQFLASHSQMSLVHCPRTHAYFGHARSPLRESLELGVNVALGTDSRASNPDLNLWEEARTVARLFPEIAPQDVLRLATVNGARALGLADRHGIIAPGRRADLCCIRLGHSDGDLLRGLFATDAAVTGVMQAGRWLVDR